MNEQKIDSDLHAYMLAAKDVIGTTYMRNANPIIACIALHDEWTIRLGAVLWLEVVCKNHGFMLDKRSTLLNLKALAKREQSKSVLIALFAMIKVLEGKR
jgi:hypothetical protein